jgi:hypothetical protein
MSPAEEVAEQVTRAAVPLWERQAGETSKQFEAFVVYRDMEDRTLHKTAAALGKSMTPIAHWAVKRNWRFRARAWEDHLQELKLASMEQEVKDMVKRHAVIALGMTNKVAARLSTFDSTALSASDMAKWLETAVKVERLSRGQPTDNISSHHEGEVTISSPLIDRLANDEEFRKFCLADSVETDNPTSSD